jgi:hypothetical protein
MLTGVDKRQPVWHLPKGGVDKGLRISNSLTRDVKTPFIPIKGNTVNWYICGPTGKIVQERKRERERERVKERERERE